MNRFRFSVPLSYATPCFGCQLLNPFLLRFSFLIKLAFVLMSLKCYESSLFQYLVQDNKKFNAVMLLLRVTVAMEIYIKRRLEISSTPSQPFLSINTMQGGKGARVFSPIFHCTFRRFCVSRRICNFVICLYSVILQFIQSPPSGQPPKEKPKNPFWGPQELSSRMSWLHKTTSD